MTLTAEQIEARKRGVGCSEILAALGKDPRLSRLELYKQKVGELPAPDLSDNERVHFGNVFEDAIRQEAGRRLGQKIIVPAQTLYHSSAPLLGHLDGWIPALNKGLEVKNLDKFEMDEFGDEGSDQVTVRFLIQCTGYISLTDAQSWYLAPVFGGNHMRIFEVPRDETLIAAILAGVTEFWSHVERRVPPEPGTPEEVKLRWPKDLGTEVIATPEIVRLCEEHGAAKRELKQWTPTEERLKADVQTFMREASHLIGPDGRLLATWKTNKSSMKFDTDRFASEHPALFESYLREVPGARPFLNKLK